MTQKLAIFIGGSRDGQRMAVERWSTQLTVLGAERARVPCAPGVGGFELAIKTFEEVYRMPHPPINPATQLCATDQYSRGGVVDADIGLYFFVGSNPARPYPG